MRLWTEIFFTGSGLLILLIYHIYLIWKVKHHPLGTSIGITNRLRLDWVEVVMSENRDLLAVQTIRNWVMASSFLASTAVLLDLAVINIAFRSWDVLDASQALNYFGLKSQELWLLKLMVLVVDFVFAFFNFTLSIRYYNHASYAINVPSKQDPLVNSKAVADIINHGSFHYTLGMRAYYLAFPLVLWLFGPAWMLAGAVSLTVILYKLDKTA